MANIPPHPDEQVRLRLRERQRQKRAAKELVRRFAAARGVPNRSSFRDLVPLIVGRPMTKGQITRWSLGLLERYEAQVKKVASTPPPPKHNAGVRPPAPAPRLSPPKPKPEPPKLPTLTLEERRAEREAFYTSPAWLSLRYRVLKHYGAKCVLCGTDRRQGAIIQVDHIKPRSTHPHLQLTFSNLQPLCAPCNYGKSNKDDTDWR